MLYEIYTTLLAHFGPLHGPAASRPWWPIFGPDPLVEIVVGAVLVQQTRWEAVEGAVGRLLAAGLLSIDGLAEAHPIALAALIRPCAFHTQKAPGLIGIARHVRERHGDLPTMLAQPSAALRQELLGLPRIGPESADVIMLYAGGHPTFVVDAYTRRLFERVGLGMDEGRTTKDEGRADERRKTKDEGRADERRKTKDEGHTESANTIWQRASYEQVRSHIEAALQLFAEAGELSSFVLRPSSVEEAGELSSFVLRPSSLAPLYAEYHAQINEQCVRYCLSRPRCDGPPARRVYSRQDGRESYHTRDEGCPLRTICQHYRGGRW